MRRLASPIRAPAGTKMAARNRKICRLWRVTDIALDYRHCTVSTGKVVIELSGRCQSFRRPDPYWREALLCSIKRRQSRVPDITALTRQFLNVGNSPRAPTTFRADNAQLGECCGPRKPHE